MSASLEGRAPHDAVPRLAVAFACDQLKVSFAFFLCVVPIDAPSPPSSHAPPTPYPPAADALNVTHNEAAPHTCGAPLTDYQLI
jgi:hypothetical protein